MKKNVFLLLFGCLSFLFCLETKAQSNPTLFTNSISSSNSIVEGKIIKQESFWNNDQTMILTRHTLEIYKLFKNSTNLSASTLTFTTIGGKVGKDIITATSHHFPINYGNSGLFLLKQDGSSYQLTTDGFIYYDILNQSASSKNNHFNSVQNEIYTQLSTPRVLKNESLFLSSPSNQRTDNITSIAPTTITAGTQSILTINGSGFGTEINEQSNIYFSFAPNGGQNDYPVLQFGWIGFFGLSEIVEWTDTRIQVRVPSVAGTGKVTVTNSNGERFVSSETLTIPYSVTSSDLYWYNFDGETPYEQEATKNYLSNYNGEGGYTLFVDPAFFANTQQMNGLTSALNKWRCATGFNVKVSANQAPIPYGSSGKTSISTFDGNEFGDITTRSYAYSNVEVCNTGTELVPFVKEFQIFVNSAINWSYSGTPAAGQVDFESEILKSLAIGHQVGYVNNPNDVMYYFLEEQQQKQTLSTTNLEAGNLMMNYTVNANNDCGLPSMQKVTAADCNNSVNPPLARFEADVTEACEPSLRVRFDNTSRNAITYQWTFIGGTPATSTEKNPTVTYAAAGNFAVTLVATSGVGSSTETKTDFIKVGNGIDYVVDLGADKVICQGESTTLDAGEVADATYLWNTGQTTRTIMVQNEGTYSVEIKKNGCSVSDQIRVSYNTSATVEAGENQAICRGEEAQLRATATGGTSYHWTPSTGLSDATILNPIATPSETTLYTLEITTGSDCGTVKDSVLVTIKDVLELPFFPIEEQIYICENDVFFIDAYPLNATNPTFRWSNRSTEPYLEITESGTYWVEVTDPNFCTFRDTIEVIATPVLNVEASTEEGQNIVCLGNTMRLHATGAAYYEWEGEGIVGDSFVSNPLVSPRETTTYLVTGYGGFRGACEPQTDTITIFVIEKPVLELGDDVILCTETSYLIDATVESSTAVYTWEDGSNEAQRTITENGMYKVEVVTECGILEDSIKVTFFVPSTLADFDFVVEGTQVTFENKTESTYELEYEWNFGDALNSTSPEQNAVFVYSEGGTYTVTLTAKAKDCEAQVSIQKGVVIEDFVTGIEDEIRAKKVNLYPNPSNTGTSVLKWQSDLGEATSFEIYNTLGQKVSYQDVNQADNQNASLSIDAQNLPKGIYIVMLSFENYTIQKKWVIE
ncbi:PDK repeat-containing protein [Bernardetia litoralis DSM 6794]|uniref:PDK repeat-containing protein n=1 Tax=Bernardetia litoralis (strain ATCC 23117 / DSM 6794 / NBRC 15988 / NCIMB 1366 / Fx l1 / Sio-4) TaxID=880071 RepID=I4AKG7_BERLS|nr:PKD domain-containing protein [Bernardetia litoralis]AFM04452.1 PDK repeat-containing protein [Bernardetia litoralis DSM 6794]